jgi:ferredoxin-nitrite reductase
MCGSSNANFEGFSPEQQKYLADLLAQLDLQALFVQPENNSGDQPQTITVHGTPYEDLCKEEKAKLDTHPWDLWPKLREHAERMKMPEGTDVFMFKHHGMFNVAPAQPGFMCRLRIAACKMRGDQLSGLADLAEQLCGGYAHVTTRGNLQVREIPPENMVKVLQGLYDLGLTSKGSGADSVRNITCSPSAGFDPDELIDLSPYAIALHHHILNTRELHGIPRKFNISFDNGGRLSCVSDTNDIALLATEVVDNANTQLPGPGVYCRLLLGGITGHLDFARDTGYALKPEDTVDACVAMLKVFIEHGDRTNRKKARLKYILDQHGLDWYIEQSQKHLDVISPGAKFYKMTESSCAPRKEIDRQGHIGVQPQKQGGYRCVGINLPVGKLKPAQMRGIGRLAMTYGRNDLRLTVWQNILLPWIAVEDVNAVLRELAELKLTTQASAFAAGAVACTGKFGCKFASAHTKSHAAQLVDYLEARIKLDTPINLHFTGCPHSCAQHYIGDIGFLGASTEDGREAYQIFLGGGSDLEQGIAQHLVGPVPADELPPFIEQVLNTYLAQRDPGERFVAFTRRHTAEQLRELFLHAYANA